MTATRLVECDFCDQDAWCVGVDDTHRYFECSGTPARHEWSELRSPTCAGCANPLTDHVPLSDREELLLLCPQPEYATFIWPEKTH